MIITWRGNLWADVFFFLILLALHEPYVIAVEPSFVEVRHIETGLLSQVIQGSNLRLLFADTPPSVSHNAGYHHPYQQT
jgi:uncharacterized protein YllA (UPF0747 family)